MNTTSKTATLIGLIVACALCALAENARIEKRAIRSGEKNRAYWLYVPDKLATPAPLIVLLHGSNQPATKLVELWKRTAQKEGIILAGPESLKGEVWAVGPDGPDFLRDVVEDVKSTHVVDGQRVYLFGFSAGAHFALQMAVLESEYFAATAYYAGALQPRHFHYIDRAYRKIPIAAYAGSEDTIVPLPAVRATIDELKKRGWQPELKLWPRDHNYYAIADEVNKDAWSFLAQHSLAGPPVYDQYNVVAPK